MAILKYKIGSSIDMFNGSKSGSPTGSEFTINGDVTFNNTVGYTHANFELIYTANYTASDVASNMLISLGMLPSLDNVKFGTSLGSTGIPTVRQVHVSGRFQIGKNMPVGTLNFRSYTLRIMIPPSYFKCQISFFKVSALGSLPALSNVQIKMIPYYIEVI